MGGLEASAQAVLMAEYTFTGDVSTPSSWNNVLLSSAGTMYAGPGLANVGYVNGQFAFPDRAKWATNWSVVALDLNDHFGVVLTPAFGFDIVVDSVSFKIRRSNTAPDTIEFRESYTGAFAFHWKAKTGPADAWRRFSITSGFTTGSGSVDLRVYGRNAIGLGGAMRIDDFRVYAHLVANGLPIELTSFTGYSAEKGVRLDWSTASEIDNDFFTVFRSLDGMSWQAIDSVKSGGDSQSLQTYSLLDPNPEIGINYYKLRQTDYDDDFEDSDVIAVVWQPFDPASAQVFDLTGKFIRDWNMSFEGLPDGVYLLRDKTGKTQKHIVARH